MKNGRTAGCYLPIGKPTGSLCVCEGFATGASVCEAAERAVIVAFSAANLRPVAEAMRAKYPELRIIIAGDNDKSGTGQRAAIEAARAVGGMVAIPAREGADWNDAAAADGPAAVRAAIGGATQPDAEPSGDAHANTERGHSWSDAPTPLVRPTPPPAPYPIEALGPILAPAARAIAEIVQVPEALAGNSVLAAAALAAQSHADVQTLGGPRPLSLFILTIAQSGDRKTAADGVALRAVHEHGKRMVLTYNSAVREWEAAQEGAKFDKRKAKNGAETGAEYASTLKEMASEPKPRAPWLICSEPTAEGLVRSLADGQLAQGIFTDEGGQFIGGHALSEDAELRTIAMLSRLWQGDRIDRVRATNHEHLVLFGRRLSMHLLVQPEVANRMLGKPLYRSQGFLARWLIAAPDSLAGTRLHNPRMPDPADDSRIVKFWHAVGELLTAPANEDREVGGLNPPVLALTPEARALLIEAYNEIERAQRDGGDLESVREFAAKAAEQACRIAAVLTLAENPAAISVSGDAMRNALALTQHHIGEYGRLIGSACVPENIVRAQALLDWVRSKHLCEVTVRQVTQFGPGRAIRHAAAAKEALRTLAEFGWAATEDSKTYRLHPAAFVKEGTS